MCSRFNCIANGPNTNCVRTSSTLTKCVVDFLHAQKETSKWKYICVTHNQCKKEALKLLATRALRGRLIVGMFTLEETS